MDVAGNRISSGNFTFTIKDFDKPAFSTPRVNNGSVITYKDTIYFQVNVTKPLNSAQIAVVNISIQIDGGIFQTFPAALVRSYVAGYNELWQYVLAPQNAFTAITYYFTAIDIAGNSNSTILRPRQVFDTFQPEMANISLNGIAEPSLWVFEYSQTINLSIRLLETWGLTNGSGVDEVYLSYRSTGTEINYTRVLIPQTSGTIMNGTWQYTIPALKWSGTVYLKIEARDNTGLEQNYLFQEFTTVQTDTQAPTISGVTILTEPNFPGYYDLNEPESFYTVNINATLTTLVNSSLVNPSKIFVQFKATTESTWRNATLLPTATLNVYTAKIHGMAWRQNITYRVYAENNDGYSAINDTHSGSPYLYYAVDRKAPAYSNPTIGVIRQDEEVDVSIDLFEPVNASGIDLSNVFVRFNITSDFTWKSNPLINVGGGTYEGKIDSFSYPTVVYYHFYCMDIKGNILIFPATNYTYTIGDDKLPVYNDTETNANRPTQVRYMTPLNFSVYCYDDDSSISSIMLTYSVGTGAPQTLTSFVKVPGTTKQQDRYVFTIPGQVWKAGTEGTITIRILEITDSSSNLLDLRGSVVPFLVYIIDPDLPILENASIRIYDNYQTMYLNHTILLNFTAYEPSGASGLKNVTVVTFNSTGDVKSYSFIDPSITQFSVHIQDQLPFSVVLYYFVITDKAGNYINTATTVRSFKVDYFETRLASQTFFTSLIDPVNTSVDLLGFYLNPTTDMTVRISEYDSNPNALGPRYTYHSIVSDVYRILFNTTSAFLNETDTGEFVFY
nr:hypothetical protein [Candidatus Sigynarchaeota archaeon]